MTTYAEKLRDPRWQKLRLEIMQRDDFTCQNCASTTATLNIHHKRYTREPWDARPSDLETLCEKCHEARTSIDRYFRWLSTKDAIALFNRRPRFELTPEAYQSIRGGA